LSNIVALWTDVDSPYVYVVDAGERRLVVVNKETHATVTQYVDDAFKDATALFVRTDTKTASIVTPSAILSFSIRE
ncbi:hypothetical protein HYV72_02435, partial [Candidatus Uhrbacteria bacterium]|nr:hypothetical protein [Candidatus Uhrbacteria bacterium]